ncbi:MAG: hypothetical protein IJM21_03835 [Clostridia bacterium]|nr:hypothetical protein [Clostridia bacterium]
MQKNNRNKTKAGGILALFGKTVLVLLVLFAIGGLVTIRAKIDKARQEVAVLSAEADLRQRTLEELENRAAEGPGERELLDAAREKGYTLPGERVFEDPNS